MKSEVYRTKVVTRDELPDLITDVIVSTKERPDALRRATYHVLTRLAKGIDVDGGIFENVLYYINCTKFVTLYIDLSSMLVPSLAAKIKVVGFADYRSYGTLLWEESHHPQRTEIICTFHTVSL